MQPIVNDFFCGCGGMGVGFLNAGYKIAGAWDFDKYAVQSYDHNVGHNSKFWNVAQNRERYYIAATRDDLPDVLQMPEQNEDPEKVPKLSLFLDDNVPERFYIPNEKAQKIIEQALKRLEELGKVHATITPDRIEKRQNGRRAKDDEEPMFTLTAQDLHGVIIQTEEDDENGIIVSEICNETGLLDPNGCGKTLRVGGGGH